MAALTCRLHGFETKDRIGGRVTPPVAQSETTLERGVPMRRLTLRVTVFPRTPPSASRICHFHGHVVSTFYVLRGQERFSGREGGRLNLLRGAVVPA